MDAIDAEMFQLKVILSSFKLDIKLPIGFKKYMVKYFIVYGTCEVKVPFVLNETSV